MHNEDNSRIHMILADEGATVKLAKYLAKQLKPGLICYLRGDLGAGKTTLVRAVLMTLGYNDRVKSPTYALVETYHVGGLDLRHLDLYRLHNETEWESAGFRDEFDGKNIFFIEWPERAQGFVPKADVEITFKILAQSREVTIYANTNLGKQCIEQL